MSFNGSNVNPDLSDARKTKKRGLVRFTDSERSRRWQLKNPERHLQNKRNWNSKNYIKQKLHSIKKVCKKLGREFNLVEQDIVVPEYCPYLNIKLTQILGQGRLDTNASIDRIDSTKGYIKNNIQVISEKANRMKNNASIQELLIFAESVLRCHSM